MATHIYFGDRSTKYLTVTEDAEKVAQALAAADPPGSAVLLTKEWGSETRPVWVMGSAVTYFELSDVGSPRIEAL